MNARQASELRPSHDNPYALSHLMEFDHVIRVNEDGSVTEPRDVYAPELYDGLLASSTGWRLMDGYSGQHRYSGPMMHQSEFIGGQMAFDILDTPGEYVALVNYEADDDGDATEWAVAFRPLNESEGP